MTLTLDNKLGWVDAVVARYLDLCTQFDILIKLTGTDVESPLGKPIFTMVDDYITAVSMLLEDNWGWLSWYVFENDCGKKALAASPGYDRRKRKIKTTKDLIRLIEEDNEASK